MLARFCASAVSTVSLLLVVRCSWPKHQSPAKPRVLSVGALALRVRSRRFCLIDQRRIQQTQRNFIADVLALARPRNTIPAHFYPRGLCQLDGRDLCSRTSCTVRRV